VTNAIKRRVIIGLMLPVLDTLDGVAQRPIERVRMAYTLRPQTRPHSRLTTPSISMMGEPALYRTDGSPAQKWPGRLGALSDRSARTRPTRKWASQKMQRTVPLILQWDVTFDLGADSGTPVDDSDYQVPFHVTGKLDKLTVRVGRGCLPTKRRNSCGKRPSGATARASKRAASQAPVLDHRQSQQSSGRIGIVRFACRMYQIAISARIHESSPQYL
jgi:hypothetical protein